MKLEEYFTDYYAFSWPVLYVVSVLSTFLWVLEEWVFAVSMPSALFGLPTWEKVHVLLRCWMLLSSVAALCILPVAVLFGILPRQKKQLTLFAAVFIPADVLVSLLLLLIDNFTCTVIGWAISTSSGAGRAVYLLLMTVLLFIFHLEIHKTASAVEKWSQHISSRMADAAAGVVLSASLLVCCLPFMGAAGAVHAGESSFSLEEVPIIFFTTEGMDADHMSLYGYERDTTPFLRSISGQALIGENAMTNSARTYASIGSIGSILTGSHAAEPRLIFPPDRLREEDAYKNLPELLRAWGYHAVQYGFEHFVDANNQGLINAFEEVNWHNCQQGSMSALISSAAPGSVGTFLIQRGERLLNRLQHIFFIRSITNVVNVVREPYYASKGEMAEGILQRLEGAGQPNFIHFHWMGTHGSRFFPDRQVFSSGKSLETQPNWDTDYYDDAGLELDHELSLLFQGLEDHGLKEKTLIILASDNDQQWVYDRRLPLVFLFPDGEFSGVAHQNSQNLDIAPTVLDYLGRDIPAWMSGSSLLQHNPEDRPVIAVDVGSVEFENSMVVLQSIQLPFYQIGRIAGTVCDQMLELDMVGYSLRSREIRNFRGTCEVPGDFDLTAFTLLSAYLESCGYDISSLSGLGQL